MNTYQVTNLNLAPGDLAEKFVKPGTKFDKKLNVLINSCWFLSQEISHNPLIWKQIWSEYMKKVTITTKPTKKGERELDVFHPSYWVKRLEKVPIKTFDDDIMIDIHNCIEWGFITLDFNDTELENNVIHTFLKNYHLTDIKDPELSNKWKLFHTEVVSRAVKFDLMNSIRQQAYEELRRQADDYVLYLAGNNFWEILMIPSYTVDKLPPRVCAFIVHPNECKGKRNTKAVSAVALNENGELLDTWTFNTIMMPW